MGADAAVAAQVRMTRLLVRAGSGKTIDKGMEPLPGERADLAGRQQKLAGV